jgi:hypothetical protein
MLVQVHYREQGDMPTLAQIEEWTEQRRVLLRQLEMLESGEMGTGNKVLRGTTAESIERAKIEIAQLDRLLSSEMPGAQSTPG